MPYSRIRILVGAVCVVVILGFAYLALTIPVTKVVWTGLQQIEVESEMPQGILATTESSNRLFEVRSGLALVEKLFPELRQERPTRTTSQHEIRWRWAFARDVLVRKLGCDRKVAQFKVVGSSSGYALYSASDASLHCKWFEARDQNGDTVYLDYMRTDVPHIEIEHG